MYGIVFVMRQRLLYSCAKFLFVSVFCVGVSVEAKADAGIDLVSSHVDMDGTESAKESIASIFMRAKDGTAFNVPCGMVWPSHPSGTEAWAPARDTDKRFFLNSECSLHSGQFFGGPVTAAVGDGNLLRNFAGGGLWFLRADYSRIASSALLHIISDNYTSNNKLLWGGGSVFPDNYIGAEIESKNGPYDLSGHHTNGSPVLLHLSYIDHSDNAWSTQSEGVKVNITKYGRSPVWGFMTHIVSNGLYNDKDAPWDMRAADLEISGYGTLTEQDRFSGKSLNRNVILAAVGPETLASRQPLTVYDDNARVMQVDRQGIKAVYSVLLHFRSGDNVPAWSYGNVQDGNISWNFIFKKTPQSPASVNNYKSWVPSSAYKTGDRIIAALPDNSIGVFEAHGKGKTGVANTASLEWPSKDNAALKDGEITWVRRVNYEFEVGLGINAFCDTSHGQRCIYGSFMGGTPSVWDAFINTVNVRTMDENGAMLRMASGQQIDFSADGTKAGANLHTLSYSAMDHAWEFKVGTRTSSSSLDQRPVLSIKDDGQVIVNSAQSGAKGILPVRVVARPESSRAPCNVGQIYDDENFHYACVKQNHWKRLQWQSGNW